ncbi:MAG TPA: PD-(D/E)XK nuclease family protein [Vicinamibacterales bacterium]|nr:PD-(D/E)XK nuclease family protein [Vicinamibacterales bacterium]
MSDPTSLPIHPTSPIHPTRPTSLQVVVSSSATERLSRARGFLSSVTPGTRVLIIGASRGAADDFARDVAAGVPATFGIQRLSLTQLAARSAMLALANEGVAPSTWLGAEAVAARAVFEAQHDASLRYFEPVASTPGFPRALARTVQELRLARVDGADVARLPLAGPDLADLLTSVETCFERAAAADRARLLRVAARVLREVPPADVVVLLDLSLDTAADREIVGAVIAAAKTTLATIPYGEASRDALEHLRALGAIVETIDSTGTDDLACLRRYLFNTEEEPLLRQLDGSLTFFSAPGEGRESIEIARRILTEARRGVRFDEIAVLVRSPHNYAGLLEHAFARAEIPAWFDRGTRRPHPAGRAFLALLACAAEQLSAARFAEYLSLAQVPQIEGDAEQHWVASVDESLSRTTDVIDDETASEERALAGEPIDPSGRVVAGTLRTPWRWEQLLVDAAVIGQTAERWARRLEGKANELERQRREAARDDGGDAKLEALERTLDQLAHLRTFALPIIEQMAAWPAHGTWGEWLDRFEALAPRVLRTPAQVLRVLADLRPMADVGPIDLEEARRVLRERLLMLEAEPPLRRHGRVFVGTPHQARGRRFRVVFVPGLAERMFPQKPREDPLLLDDLRERLDASLQQQRHRLASERVLLQLAIGAASDRVYVSYPRIELNESRARVPSFYALDVMRAATGRVPHHELLEERARVAGDASLAWPSPTAAGDAIDDQEHDLAVLRGLLDERNPDAVKGHAHYLLKLNECLRRSVIDRWAHGARRWSANDGLTRVSPFTTEALAARRLTRRAYSLSSLQKFSVCPYQFVLAAFYRLQPFEIPEPLQRMDPLTRGSLFHEMQAQFFRELQSRQMLPVTGANADEARRILDQVIGEVGSRAKDELAPAVERVWDDETAAIRRDLHTWLDHLARDGAEWIPSRFEWAFGSVPGERDATSVQQAVTLPGGFLLKGAIDLIEEHRQTKVLRVTDHKTGRRPDKIEKIIIGGGSVLQPVLYAMAVEAALGGPVSHGRLFYCTANGGFHEHGIPLDERTSAMGLEVLQVVDRAIESGFLAAVPTEDACARCDFRPVCGPGVFRRVLRKPRDPQTLADLGEIRSRP